MSSVLERYSRSFYDALSLARNSRDQATIFYSKDGVRAAYDVVTEKSANTGTMFIRGRCITVQDVPPTMAIDRLPAENAFICATNATAAKQVFEYNGIDVSIGWDLRP